MTTWSVSKTDENRSESAFSASLVRVSGVASGPRPGSETSKCMPRILLAGFWPVKARGFREIARTARLTEGGSVTWVTRKKSACARLESMKPRILVVDDETVIAENLRLTLEREGRNVETAANTEGPTVETAANTVGAMLRMETREFALAIVDLILPDGDGLHLLRLLKAKDPSIEVIIMTGHGSISKAVEATKQGAFYFVAKPFDADEMLMLVSKAVQRARLPADQAGLRDAGVGGIVRRQRAHRGRERDRQGAGRQRGPRQEHPGGRADGEDQLRGAPEGPDRVLAVRPRQGGLHRGVHRQAGPPGGGAPRLAAARRDHRDATRPPGQAAAGP